MKNNLQKNQYTVAEKGGITVANNGNKKIIKHEYDKQGKIICNI